MGSAGQLGLEGDRPVNELLASAWHAVYMSKMTPDIVQSFAIFYEEEEVAEAYAAMQ